MRRLVAAVIAIGVVGGAAFWLLTVPRTIAADEMPAHAPDVTNGELVFWASGCESCHADPDARGEDRLRLGGGRTLSTPFGNFTVPNISPDPVDGIGGWTPVDFVNAMKYGVAPGGYHLYPAFPYPSYQRMTIEDVIDLKAFMDTLPPISGRAAPHDLGFPFTIRRGIGLWKWLYAGNDTFVPDPAASDLLNRGAYLVQGPGHCGECHTPRNAIGGPTAGRAYAGGPSPVGKGKIPNITPHRNGIGTYSPAELVTLFETGLTPSFDSVGSEMALVVLSLGELPKSDLEAIAAYLMTLSPLASR